MFFLIQKDEGYDDLELEHLALKLEIKNYSSALNKYIECGIDEIQAHLADAPEITPVGSISFVSKFLKLRYNIAEMCPIEIPKELREERFLKRQYTIVKGDSLPTKGNWFIKDASVLKNAIYMGDIRDLKKYIDVDRNHLYVVSERVKIKAEYRVFVQNDKIEGIQFYDGLPDLLPTEAEVEKLKQMIGIYSMNSTRPTAYAMDIGIMFKNEQRDLILIEMCPFACLGTYGFTGYKLPEMYKNGFKWYLENNQPVEP